MSLAERLRPATPTRRWVGVGAAALGWFALYEVTLHQAQQTGAQVKAALAEHLALTNVTVELEETPTLAPTSRPKPT